MKFSNISAEKYLKEVGYTSNFIYVLKNKPPSILPLPKIINTIHKKYFLKLQNIEVGEDESIVVAVASFIFDFILEILDKNTPFSDLGQFRIAPIFVLPSLYEKRKQAIFSLLKKLKPFEVRKSNQSFGFFKNGRKFQNFYDVGTIQLQASSGADLKTIFSIPILGKKFAAEHQVFFHPESGTSIRIFQKNLVIFLTYRMEFTQQFSFDGIKDPKKWIDSNISTSWR